MTYGVVGWLYLAGALATSYLLARVVFAIERRFRKL